jgi:hypothetical protein
VAVTIAVAVVITSAAVAKNAGVVANNAGVTNSVAVVANNVTDAARSKAENGAGGTVPQTRSLRGLVMKTPNAAGAWTNVPDVDQRIIAAPTSASEKTSTIGSARIITSTLLRSW